jgi:hypothetical protein
MNTVRMSIQAVLAASVLVLTRLCVSAQDIAYTPIPPGFDFPANEKVLLDALKAGDELTLRNHGWMVFAGLTQPARPSDPVRLLERTN